MSARRLLAVGLSIGTTLCGGCALAPWNWNDKPPALAEPIAEVVAEPQAAQSPPDVAPAPPVAPVAPVAQTPSARIAIVVSDDIPEYQEIVDEILRRGAEGVTVHRLSGQVDDPDRLLEEIAGAQPNRIVAIGLLAATVARRIPDTPMVFCQVYNYQDHALLSAKSKGVHLLPPFDLQLQAWQRLASAQKLHSIGVITGPGQDEVIADIQRAVAPSGVALTVRTVAYDQAALLAFKDLAPEIDGLWLLPDNRILSPDVVREIMSLSAKHGTQLVVFGESLLDMGALLSVSSEPRDVVDRVFARFDDMEADGRLRGPDLLRLTDMRMRVNAEVARRLALTVPEQVAHSR